MLVSTSLRHWSQTVLSNEHPKHFCFACSCNNLPSASHVIQPSSEATALSSIVYTRHIRIYGSWLYWRGGKFTYQFKAPRNTCVLYASRAKNRDTRSRRCFYRIPSHVWPLSWCCVKDLSRGCASGEIGEVFWEYSCLTDIPHSNLGLIIAQSVAFPLNKNNRKLCGPPR